MTETKTKYLPTIGLEIHAELKTKTKMFCDSLNNPDEEKPNVNICPICLGHPGTLPTLNKEAIKKVLMVGHAVGGEIADFTEWDRKNYFYPDIPKGYQISQYKYPLVSGGKINEVKITRIHLEEDTGTSIHDRGDYSLVNYNRAGVPLMELVTEPVIHGAKQAADFARELQLLLRYLDVSDANMEKGEMRVEANISVAPEGSSKLGVKVEVKNLNSFKVVERAIDFEVNRMINLIEDGRANEIIQETRGWDDAKQRTFSQRIKETSDDYRYFPEPDLPKLKISEIPEFNADKLKSDLPELPWQKRQRLNKIGVTQNQVDLFVRNPDLSKFFDSVSSEFTDKKEIVTAVNYLSTDLISLIKDAPNFDFKKLNPKEFIELIKMIVRSEISSRGAKDILAILVKEGGNVREIAKKNNLLQQSDSNSLKEVVEKIIVDNQKVADEYLAGKETALQYLVGQCMKATKGSANPQILSKILIEILNQKKS